MNLCMSIDTCLGDVKRIFDSIPRVEPYKNSVIGKDLALKLLDMDPEAAYSYAMDLGLSALDLLELEEVCYVLCSDGDVVYVGRYRGGEVPTQAIATAIKRCKGIAAVLHSHPIPLPIPTIEDMISADSMGYRMECVVSKGDSKTWLTCVEPKDGWREVMKAMEGVLDAIMSRTSRFLVASTDDTVMLLPYPSDREVELILNDFSSRLREYAYVNSVVVEIRCRGTHPHPPALAGVRRVSRAKHSYRVKHLIALL